MGRSTVAAFKENAELVGAESVGEVFAPLDSKDYSQYFGRVRSARPEVLYTSVAGNDTVRLFTQMKDFGVLDGLTVLGASGTVTGQNIGAIGDAAEGFITGVGYSPLIDSPENKAFVEKFNAENGADPDLYGADSYGILFAYKAAVEAAGGAGHALDRDLKRSRRRRSETCRNRVACVFHGLHDDRSAHRAVRRDAGFLGS